MTAAGCGARAGPAGAGLITAVVLGIRYLNDSGRSAVRPPATRHRPEDLLAERYARGEIDDEEYRRRLEPLREHRFAA